jgi:peptidoglycan/LPS O-acetylase OafA/YrhL
MGPILAPFGLQSWVPGASTAINFPSWSISDEAFFYLLFPVLLPALLVRPWRWLGAAGLFMVAVWASTGWLWHEFGGGYGLMASIKTAPDSSRLAAQFIKFFPLCHVQEFVLGMVLYVLWVRTAWRWPGLPLLAAGLGLFLVLVNAAEIIPAPVFHNGLMTLPFALLILGGANLRAGGGSPLVFLGKASYGMYLFHAPLYRIVGWLDQTVFQSAVIAVPFLTEAIALAAVLALACWLHLAFEEPLRRRIMRWRGMALAQKLDNRQGC